MKKAPLVRLALETFATGLYALEDIRKLLNEKEPRTDKKEEISSQTMHKIINNPFYCGKMRGMRKSSLKIYIISVRRC